MQTFKRVAISQSSSGNIAAADPINPQFLIALHIAAAGTVAVKVTDGTNDLTGAMPMVANGQINFPHCPAGHAKAGPGMPLALGLSATIAVTGHAVIAVGDPTAAF